MYSLDTKELSDLHKEQSKHLFDDVIANLAHKNKHPDMISMLDFAHFQRRRLGHNLKRHAQGAGLPFVRFVVSRKGRPKRLATHTHRILLDIIP